MQAARRAWSEAQPAMDVEKLVFIDETWATTNMTRSHGRAPRGTRCIGSAPLGDWQTTTFVAALRHNQLTAPMVVDGRPRCASLRAPRVGPAPRVLSRPARARVSARTHSLRPLACLPPGGDAVVSIVDNARCPLVSTDDPDTNRTPMFTRVRTIYSDFRETFG